MPQKTLYFVTTTLFRLNKKHDSSMTIKKTIYGSSKKKTLHNDFVDGLRLNHNTCIFICQ